MPMIVKALVYFAVLALIVYITNALPKSTEPLKGLAALCAVVWMFGGVFIILRAVFRFVTR